MVCVLQAHILPPGKTDRHPGCQVRKEDLPDKLLPYDKHILQNGCHKYLCRNHPVFPGIRSQAFQHPYRCSFLRRSRGSAYLRPYKCFRQFRLMQHTRNRKKLFHILRYSHWSAHGNKYSQDRWLQQGRLCGYIIQADIFLPSSSFAYSRHYLYSGSMPGSGSRLHHLAHKVFLQNP